MKIVVCLLPVLCSALAAQDAGSWQKALNAGVDDCIAGRYREAKTGLEALLAEAQWPDRDARRLRAKEVLAVANRNLRDIQAALAGHAEVLAKADAQTPEGKKLRLQALANLAEIRVEQGEFRDAEALLTQALAVAHDIFGETGPEVVTCLENLASAEISEGKWETAVPLLQESVQFLRPAAAKNPKALLSDMGSLGSLYTRLGRYSQALPLLEEAVAEGTRTLPHDPALADALMGLGTLYREQGNIARAEPLLQKAKAIYEQAGDMADMRGGAVLSDLGLLRLSERKYLEAEQYFRSSLAILRTSYGADHFSAAVMEVNLAMACLRLGKDREADELLRHSYPIEEDVYGASWSMALWLQVRAQWEAKQGHLSEADARFRQAIAMMEKVAGEDHPATAGLLAMYADFLKPRHKKEAATLKRQAAAIFALRK